MLSINTSSLKKLLSSDLPGSSEDTITTSGEFPEPVELALELRRSYLKVQYC